MDGWNKIDLHQHTDHDIDCKGKKLGTEYTHLSYYLLLKEQKVKLKAVTCHNNIDLCSHIKHAIIADFLGINHLVGVEIDYRFGVKEFQAITILSPNVDVIAFSNSLANIRSRKGHEIYLNEEDFCLLHENTEFIFIPHAMKEKGIFNGELEKGIIDWTYKALVTGSGFPVLFENTKEYYLHSMIGKIKEILKISKVDESIPAYTGSDYKFDNNEQRKKAIRERVYFSINSLPTYRGLEIAIRNADTRLSSENQIINRERYIKSITIKKNSCVKEGVIKLSPGLNVIIGNSGSGKTLLLNQIYYEIKEEPLSAATTRNEKKGDSKQENPYYIKLKSNKILDIEFDSNRDKRDIKVLEIPNIYSEILRSQDDVDNIMERFGINNSDNATMILLDYRKKISDFYSLIKSIDDTNKLGNETANNISSAIDFLSKNIVTKNLFSLEKKIFDRSLLDSLVKKREKINKTIENEKSVCKYFEDIKNLFTNELAKQKVDSLINIYLDILKLLSIELGKTNKQIEEIKLEERIEEIINNCINDSTEKLGNKERSVKNRFDTLSSETNKIIQLIKQSIILEKKEKREKIVFPYKLFKKEIETNANDYARLTLDESILNIKKINVEDSKLINLDKIKVKVKALHLSQKTFDLLDSDSSKNLIRKLSEAGINLGEIISEYSSIPKNVELYIQEFNEWRIINKINKGDIAKKSIEYYFSSIIKDSQPDIIFIDQPENDVDKSFITETLSSFIKKQKIEKQIIITSHDAIIAINSDANRIIEARISDDNMISYDSYGLEYVEGEKLTATNRVSTILDGGKRNIKKRYQIYGGEITYEGNN